MSRKLTSILIVTLALVVIASLSAYAGDDDRWYLRQISYTGEIGQIFWAGLSPNYLSAEAGALYMEVKEFTYAYPAAPGPLLNQYYTTTFCVDGQYFYGQDYFTKAVGGPPASNSPAQDPAKWSRIVYLNQQYYYSVLNDSAKAAGLQLAYWEIVNDYGTASFADFSLGNFRASGFSASAMIYASQYLSALPADLSNFDYSFQTYYWDGQNQIDRPDVPEPFTILYGIMGIGSIIGLRKLRKA